MKYLEKSPYDVPLDIFRITRYLRGDLIGESEKLAEEGNAYPYFELKTTLKPAQGKTDDTAITFEENAKAHIGKDIVFRAKSFEAWGPKK